MISCCQIVAWLENNVVLVLFYTGKDANVFHYDLQDWRHFRGHSLLPWDAQYLVLAIYQICKCILLHWQCCHNPPNTHIALEMCAKPVKMMHID